MPSGTLCGEVRDCSEVHYRSRNVRRWALGALVELRRRDGVGIAEGLQITRPSEVAEALAPIFRGSDQEMFVGLALNGRNHLATPYIVSIGTLTASLVHPREVFRPALLLGAASIIVAHNHPSGNPQPSDEDKLVTKQLVSAGDLIGIKVLDHVIWSHDGCASFRDLGILEGIGK